VTAAEQRGGEGRTAAIVGLGLMGGSVARDLAAAGVRVLGHDRDRAVLRRAMEAGIVAAPLGRRLDGIARAHWLILAVPVDVAPVVLAAALPWSSGLRLITDVGSTKRGIVETAERLGCATRFIGAHPLAGDHRAGWQASRSGMFDGSRVFLCPAAGAGPAALDEARRLWRLCGAATEVLGAEAHDERVAWLSHLPQLLSTALALTLRSAGVAAGQPGRGGRDMIRLAGGSSRVWTGILLENADMLAPAIARFRDRLADLESALAAGRGPPLQRLLQDAASWADSG
jgi:prephenate dehydrogenase